MLKNMRLVILFAMLLNPSFKMTTSFANMFSSSQTQLKDKSDVHYFKLRYVGNL